MRTSCFTLLLVLSWTHIRAATPPAAPDFLPLVEDICAQPAAAEAAHSTLEQRLWDYYQYPLDLNRTSRETLGGLCILTETQLDHLFAHMAHHGPLVSIYELQAIPTLDLPTIRRLLPFAHVDEAAADYRNQPWWTLSALRDKQSYASLRYQQQFPDKKGYQYDPKKDAIPYAGSPHNWAVRLHIRQPWGLGLGLSAQKRPGEATYTQHPKTGEHYLVPWRCHLLLKDQKYVKAWILGDYAVGYGQGLVLNAGFSMNKSSETVNLIRTNNLGIRPHTTTSQAALRGTALTWQWHPMEATLYLSSVPLDSTVKNDADTEYVQTLYRGGYYRTTSEQAKRAAVQETMIGGTLLCQGPTRGAHLGINALCGQYSLPLRPDLNKRSPLSFRGQRYTNTSLFYRYLWYNLHFFGEGGLSLQANTPLQPQQLAALAGVVASLSRYADATLLWRHYGQGFYSPYGRAFRQNSSANSNEQGIYLGAKIRPWRRLHLHGYYDHFYHPWKQGCPPTSGHSYLPWRQGHNPASGYSWLLKAEYQLSRKSLVYWQYKFIAHPKKETPEAAAQRRKVASKAKPKTSKSKKTPEEATYMLARQHTHKLCARYAWSRHISTRTEAQCICHQHDGPATAWGHAVVQDIVCKVRPLQLRVRIAYFHTTVQKENKAAKRKRKSLPLYFYEHNVWRTGFNFKPYRGHGLRYCILACYKPLSIIRLEAKYALTHYYDRASIGQGPEEIKAPYKHELALQATCRF